MNKVMLFYWEPDLQSLPEPVVNDLRDMVNTIEDNVIFFSWDDEDNEDWPALAGYVQEHYNAYRFIINLLDLREALEDKPEAPEVITINREWLEQAHRDLDACQKVLWQLGGNDPQQMDLAYCRDAQRTLRQMEALLGGDKL